MIRVRVIVEGQTEESFVNDVLAPCLWTRGVLLEPTLLGVPGHKGGRPSYSRLCKDLQRHLKGDAGIYCTTMLDLYGLGDDFPGMPLPASLSGDQKSAQVEKAICADFGAQLPDCRPDLRLLPYIQAHEFEALLFSDPAAFAGAIDATLEAAFREIRSAFATPEDINDGPDTAPSKRILAAYPRYRKPIQGTLSSLAIGVDRMRGECPHFDEWIRRLSSLKPLAD